MYQIVGDYYGIQTVIRGEDEEYIDDCVDHKSESNQIRIMFWGAITYGKKAGDCPYVVYESKTKEEKQASTEFLRQINTEALKDIAREREIFYDEQKIKRAALPRGQRGRGRPKLPELNRPLQWQYKRQM